MGNYKISDKGIEVLKLAENFEPKPYFCSAGKLTIGFGSVIDTKEEEYLKKAVINRVQATALLKKDLVRFENVVNKLVKSNISQKQFDALVIFAFNCGEGGFASSTLLKKVNINPNDPTIKDEFLRWDKVDGTKNKKDDDGDGLIDEAGEKRAIDGLTNRRMIEIKLYFS